MTTIIIFILVLFSISLHEASHGFMAFILNDKTAKEMKRLTLNPLKHIDIIGTIILPLILLLSSYLTGGTIPVFGYAKPVPVNPRNFKYPRVGMALVGIAGPLSNIFLAILSAFLLIKFKSFLLPFKEFFIILIQINLFLTVFNLMPIPPLDGSKVISLILPKQLAVKYENLSLLGFILLIFILQTDIITKFYMAFSKYFIILCGKLFQ